MVPRLARAEAHAHLNQSRRVELVAGGCRDVHQPAVVEDVLHAREELPARAEVVRVEMDDRQVERLAKGARQAGLAAPPAPMTAIRFKAAAGPDELAPR